MCRVTLTFDAFSFRLGFSKRVKWNKPRKRKLVSNKLNGHDPRRHLFPTGFERKASPTFLFVTKIPRTATGKNVKIIGKAWNSSSYGRPRSVIRRDRAMGWSSLDLLVIFKLAEWTVTDRLMCEYEVEVERFQRCEKWTHLWSALFTASSFYPFLQFVVLRLLWLSDALTVPSFFSG